LLAFLVNVLNRSREDSANEAEKEATVNTQNTKDDIARLLHLFKEPVAQVHWSNLYGVLNRAELDARKTDGPLSDAANALSCLAEIFNDYETFCPQNLMVEYVTAGRNQRPVKRTPFAPSSEEWAVLANETHDIEPTNLSRRNILRDEAWIKATWNDCRKWLHQTFVQYNRSGQHDADMGEWCSPKELERWVRATKYKTAASNTIIRYPTVMVYSICLLDQSDFESVGRKMPKGTGVDSSIADGTKATKRKRGKYNKQNNSSNQSSSNQSLLDALNDGTKSESKMAALRLILEFGTAAQKAEAMKEIQTVAYGNRKRKSSDMIAREESEGEEDDEGDGDDSDSATTLNN
jgi:hypothetical protein